jgi:acetyl-CoA carboxylase carboxyl transferase subunit alpha
MNGMGLDFEQPVYELERKIEDLKAFAAREGLNLDNETRTLIERLEKVKKELFNNLTPWQRVQIARHPKRPYTLDYVNGIMTDFCELHGDRTYGDDKAIVGGMARIDGQKVIVFGHQKGRDTKENLMRNFGSAHPEGYRKCLRLVKLAEKFGIPIISFIDTPGAYPGIGAEERGQAQAIADNIYQMIEIKVPIVVVVIGEGGSGGALGIGVGDRILMLGNAYYSVISPEGCAAILWKDRTKAPEAAGALKLCPEDLLSMGIIDEIIKEPPGGAHREYEGTFAVLKSSIKRHLAELVLLNPDELVGRRYKKFRSIGVFAES